MKPYKNLILWWWLINHVYFYYFILAKLAVIIMNLPTFIVCWLHILYAMYSIRWVYIMFIIMLGVYYMLYVYLILLGVCYVYMLCIYYIDSASLQEHSALPFFRGLLKRDFLYLHRYYMANITQLIEHMYTRSWMRMRWDMIVGGSRWTARTRSSLEITVMGHILPVCVYYMLGV